MPVFETKSGQLTHPIMEDVRRLRVLWREHGAMNLQVQILVLAALLGGTALLSLLARGHATRAAESAGLPWPEPDPKALTKLTNELRTELKDGEFRISHVGPWIIATDLDAESSRRFVDGTITAYAAAIQRQLFTSHARSEPVKVYLFRDEKSYSFWNEKLFGEKPNTPYGYYSHGRNALVMNIGTGGGTLLHEMVHAMTEVDFPGIPAWLNEGLGSLFEASSRQAQTNRVIGVTNWRLKGLQDEIAKGTAPKLSDLLVIDDEQFYDGHNSSANYAAVRYLMQYLQEHGKLEAFYIRVRGRKESGPVALRAVFDNKRSLDEIEKDVYNWAKGLRSLR